MNRLQKKCFIATTGAHLLLLGILFFGSAFISAKNPANSQPVLDFVPSIVVDAAVMGGGNPDAKPPPPAPPQIQPVSQPPASKPEPQKPVVKEPETKPSPAAESLEAGKESKKKIEVNTQLVTRKTNAQPAAKPAQDDSRARQLADARRRAAVNSTLNSLRNGLSSSTIIDTTEYGPGGGGATYAGYAQVVQSIYDRAWTSPEDMKSVEAVVKVKVTIASDGTVISARIVEPSGDSQVDKSVQQALDRVTFIEPFPEGAKEKQRTYEINFKPRAKRSTG